MYQILIHKLRVGLPPWWCSTSPSLQVVLLHLHSTLNALSWRTSLPADRPGSHLEVVQKHSCAGSFCTFLPLASQTHYCASHPNHNHMGPSAVLEFSHCQKHINCAELPSDWIWAVAVTSSMNERLLSSTCCVFIGTNEVQCLLKCALELPLLNFQCLLSVTGFHVSAQQFKSTVWLSLTLLVGLNLILKVEADKDLSVFFFHTSSVYSDSAQPCC